MPHLPDRYEEVVNQIWDENLQKSGNTLFDGQIFSVSKITPDYIEGFGLPYRYFFAQKVMPDLSKTIKIQPLAVTGILQIENSWVAGRRSNITVTQDAGLWEFVPSGSVDMNQLFEIDNKTLTQQILEEAREELGVDPELLQVKFANLFIEDEITFVIDCVFFLSTELTFSELSSIHREFGTDEYSELELIGRGKKMENYDNKKGNFDLSATSQYLLSKLGN